MHPTHTSINHRQSEVPSRRCSTRKSTRAAEHPSRRNAKGYLRQLYVTAISGTNSLGPDRTRDFAKRIYNRHSCASVINSRTNRKAKAYWRSHASKAPRSLSAKHLLDDTRRCRPERLINRKEQTPKQIRRSCTSTARCINHGQPQRAPIRCEQQIKRIYGAAVYQHNGIPTTVSKPNAYLPQLYINRDQQSNPLRHSRARKRLCPS